MKNFIQNPNQKVVITFDNQTTLARIYENNKVIAKGVAVCSPEDEFDIVAGATLAIERAMDTLIPKKCEQKWVVVNREPKVGDYIRLTKKEYEFDEIGDIHKISTLNEYLKGVEVGVLIEEHTKCKEWLKDKLSFMNWPNKEWYYAPGEFEIIEPVGDVEIINGERFRKVNRKAKPGDHMRIIESYFPYEKPGNIYKISEINGNTLEVRHGDHPEHKSNIYGFNDDYLWHHRINDTRMKVEILEKL